MKKAIQDFLSFRVIRQDQSKINGLIKVVMVFNRPRLIVGGMVQSGGLVKKIWDKGIKKLKRERLKVKKALILGFGGGDCAFAIDQYYPKAQVTGVEIDKKIIEASKNYFNLNQLKKLKVIIGDGVKFIAKTKDKYDLIVVDVYLGQKTPKGFKTKRFFREVKKRLNKNGAIIFNHLFFKKYKDQAKRLIETMEPEFNKIRLVRVASNLLILGSA
jgi:spermidine synthase